jgi:hypothetical protein
MHSKNFYFTAPLCDFNAPLLIVLGLKTKKRDSTRIVAMHIKSIQYWYIYRNPKWLRSIIIRYLFFLVINTIGWADKINVWLKNPITLKAVFAKCIQPTQ